MLVRSNQDYGNSARIVNHPLATANGQPVVFEQLQDLIKRNVVNAATTANVALTGTQTIDGVVLAAGDLVLVKNQTTASENGPYTVAAGAWARAPWADAAIEVWGGSIVVTAGTVNGDQVWTNTNNTLPTLGTTALTYAMTGSTTGGLAAATTAQLNAGTPANLAATTDQLLASDYARRFTATFGDGTATTYTITHNIGRQHVIARVFDATTNREVGCDILNASANTVTIDGFITAPAANALRVVVVG